MRLRRGFSIIPDYGRERAAGYVRFKSNYCRLIYVAQFRATLFHGDLGRAINR